MNKSKIVISSSRLAGWLMFNRMRLIHVREDLKYNDRLVFVFHDTPQVRELMNNYNEYKDKL